MGRATILENKSEGKYRCLYWYGTEIIAREQLIIGNKIIQFNHDVIALTDEITTLTAEFDAANTALQAVLAEPGPMTEDRKKRLSAALAALSGVGIKIKEKEAAKELTKLQKQEAVDRSLTLSALPESEERELWMADYSAEIEPTGADIPTAEVAGEAHGENWALLYPARGEAPLAFDQALHGEREHALAISPAACFAAWAMLPSWQKYRPSYRVGRILEMRDDGLAKVELQVPLVSSEQNLPIPPSDPMAVDVAFERQTHERVPFDYMDCGSIAFKVGDEVVIKYKEQDSTQPVIVGFAHDPEPCSAINVFTSNKERLRYSARDKGAWVSVRSSIVPRFGSCYWTGDGGAVSWVGWRARYFQARRPSIFPQFPDGDEDFTSTSIAFRGQNYGPCPGLVLGGCRRKTHLFAVCRVGTREVLYSCPVVGKVVWTEIGGVDAAKWLVLTPWYFSQTGARAASSKGVDALTAQPGTQLVELQMPEGKVVPPFSASFRVSEKVPHTIVFAPLLPGADSGEGTIVTEHSFAVDYVDETLVTLDRRVESRIGNYFFDGGSRIHTVENVTVLCGALSLEVQDWRYLQVRDFTADGTRTTQTLACPENIDHLNVTGGVGKVVRVTRRIDGRSEAFAPVGGGDTAHHTATQRMTLTSGVDKLNMLPVTRTATEVVNDDSIALNSLFAPNGLTSIFPLSYTVATRTGHLVTSMPLVAAGRAMPPLPVSSSLRVVGGGIPIGAG